MKVGACFCDAISAIKINGRKATLGFVNQGK